MDGVAGVIGHHVVTVTEDEGCGAEIVAGRWRPPPAPIGSILCSAPDRRVNRWMFDVDVGSGGGGMPLLSLDWDFMRPDERG